MSDTIYGLTASGFVAKPLSVCVDDLIQGLKNQFGADIASGPDSVFGQIAAICAKPTADLWQQVMAIYASRSRMAAEGVSLDVIAEYVGLVRAQPLASSVIAYVGGVDQTTVPAGTLFAMANGAVFSTTADVTISNPGGASAILQRVTVTAEFQSGTISVAIAGPYGSYTASTSANQAFADIVTALVDAINAQVSSLGITASAVGNVITLIANNKLSPFTVTEVVGDVSLGDAYNNTVFARGVETGPMAVPPYTLTVIQTPVSGLVAVTNANAGVIGQDLESDTALRVRIITAPNFRGKATEKAIASLVLFDTAAYGVESVFVVSNRLLTSDGAGRPAKSFEVYVQGPYDSTDPTTLNAIAQAIYDSEPAGIRPVSTASGPLSLQGTATDQTGNPVTVPFSLPNQAWVWLWVDLTANTKETFPANGEVAVQAALTAFGATAEVSDDVILGKFDGPIYSIPGIRTATIYAVVTEPNPISPPSKPGSPATQSDAQFTIAAGTIAVYDSSRIVVVMA